MALAWAYYETGKTVSAIIRNQSNQYADVVAEAMESYDAADIDDYDTAATETGDTGEYYITWPDWLDTGIYTVQWIPQAAASIAESDLPNRFALDSYYWDGTDLRPVLAVHTAAILADTNAIDTLTKAGGDGDLAAILEDTGTTLDNLLDTLVARLTAARAAKLDLLKAGNVTVTAPVNASDDVSITQRDDYATGNGRALEWSSTGGSWMQGDLGNSSIKLGIRNRHTGADYERDGTITSSTAPQAVQVALPSTFTASLTPGAIYKYQLRAQSTAGLLETLATGDLDADGTILGAAT